MRKSFWYLPAISLALSLIIGPMLRDGMFLDGLVYTDIAKNLAAGTGSVWAPLVFRKGAVFYEHPVLLPWIESFFFRLFGDGLHTEDYYNFTIFALTVLFLYKIWALLVDPTRRWLFFFPLLLWILNQEVQLRYPNAMLECGTTLVVLITTFFYIKTFDRSRILSYLIVGFGAVIAFFSKGPFGLFVMSVPFLHSLVVKKRWSITALAIPLLSAVIFYSVVAILIPEAHEFVLKYLDQQVFAAIQGNRVENIADSRFDFLFWLLVLNIPAIGIILLMLLIPPKVTKEADIERLQNSWWLLSIGAAALLPLAISIKQAAYYQLVGLPFIILGFSLLVLPRVEEMVNRFNSKRLLKNTVSVILIASVIGTTYFAFSMLGDIDRRDRDMIGLVDKIGRALKERNVTNYTLEISGDSNAGANTSYRLAGYLARYHNVHLNQLGEEPYHIVIQSGGKFEPGRGRVKILEEANIFLLGPDI